MTIHHPTAYYRSGPVEVRIVRTPEEFSMVWAIRGAVFLGEEDNITYYDEFNGNDFSATHMLAFVDGAPAGVIRIRYFAEFVLLERVGILRRYRSFAVFAALARAALQLARQKGYRTAAGRARKDTVNLWKRFGGRISGQAIEMYRGTLIPVVHDIRPLTEKGEIPFGPFGDPAFEDLIVQPEGNWDFSKAQAGPRALQAAE
ncbi:MAG: GNAT family N-acetyltransferase [Magnetospirillum sp.]|nr:GNAT family N-acetyltransferase [Magnetospirillum sp.]